MSFVCFDVGGTAIKYGLFSLQGELSEKGEYPTPHSSKEAFYDSIIEKIREYEKIDSIDGVGISMPGFINPDMGQAITAGALLKLYGENIVEAIQSEVSYPISIENDANCAALAEMKSGHAKGVKHFLLITIGTGIGGAIVLNGELFRGNTFRAGEFGMMRMDVSRYPDATAHDLAATSSLIRFYKEAKGIASETSIDARMIMQEKETDSEIRTLFNDWLDYLATVVFNAASFFNPEKILIGGGISMDATLIPALEERLNKNKDWEEMKTVIQNCKYFNEAGLRGVYTLISEKINQNKLV